MKRFLPAVFVFCSALLLASCCKKDEGTISIRFHNASDQDYLDLKVDPTASSQHFIQAGSLTAGSYSGYVEVSESFAYPIIDVSCFYAQYSFVPTEANPVIANDAGQYTYHIGLVQTGEMTHELTVSQTAE